MNDSHDIAESRYIGTPVSERFLNNTSGLPVIIEPSVENFDFDNWLLSNRFELESTATKYGGILFRGFSIDTIEKFNGLMKKLSDQEFKYIFRSSPRHSLADRVYESTTYPQNRRINLHSEQSYSYATINKIIFCCIREPDTNGETPIADNRRILANLSSTLRQKFETKGILYKRNLSPFIGMPWQEVFQTKSKEAVIKDCTENKIDFLFEGDDILHLKWTKEAIITHPVSGEQTWFNHAYFFSKYSLFDEMGIKGDSDLPEHLLPYDTNFGDGTPISYDEYCEVKSSYDQETIYFPWRKGDMLFLDNMLTSHGRNSFTGNRQIVVSML